MGVATLRERIADLLEQEPGLTDREISDRLLGRAAPQQGVNQTARAMAAARQLDRRSRPDGKIGNYPPGTPSAGTRQLGAAVRQQSVRPFGEDEVKRALQTWLEAHGWTVATVFGRGHGIDLDARRGAERWVIETKGEGSRDPMRVNYFLAILGELLQRMSDPDARYSLAVPDLPQFRRLWDRLPPLAKSRTGITALFVTSAGDVEEVP